MSCRLPDRRRSKKTDSLPKPREAKALRPSEAASVGGLFRLEVRAVYVAFLHVASVVAALRDVRSSGNPGVTGRRQPPIQGSN
jgi:hypothetical protein